MDSIPGDQWIGEYARWLRVHEDKLGDVAASAAVAKRNATQKASVSGLSTTFWNVVSLGTANTNTDSPSQATSSATTSSTASILAARPMLLRQNPHNLYYLLIRFEELGLPVGSLDSKIPIAARPTSYFSFIAAAAAADKDRDDTMSMSSMRSRISVVSSSFSSSLSWFGSASIKPDPSRDVKYIYSCFTKIPSLRLGPIPARKLIQDFEDCPGQSAVPLDVFKNLQMLELDDVDPRTLIGWDRVCIQLRSLSCKKSNIEDLTDFLVDLVIVDTKRRCGENVDPVRLRRAPRDAEHLPASTTTHASDTDLEDDQTEPSVAASTVALSSAGQAPTSDAVVSLPKELPSLAWHFLRYLNLSSNNLTFVPNEPLLCLSGLTNLDLSSNLLNVVPPSLSHLRLLTSLNMSDNLIDSVLGIYDALPAIRVLNLAKNRLESLCGLERLYTLQRIDLRGNAIYEAGEVGRLAPLPAIAEVWIKENPLVEELVDYRVDCFVEFAQEGRSVTLDGEAPGFFQKQRISERVPNAAELFAQASSRSSRSVDRSAGGTPKASRRTAEETEEDEAQLAKDVATTSRSAIVINNVRHRPASRSTNVANTRGSSKNGGQKDTRSRSTSRNCDSSRLQSGASSAQGGKRRNQRMVELDATPQKPTASSSRERALTESDRIKQAALSGNSTAAMESPDAGASTLTSTEVKTQAQGSRSPSLQKNGKMSLSRKAGVSVAQLECETDQSTVQERISSSAAEEETVASSASNAGDGFAAHSSKLFALPPGMSSSDVATPASPSRAGQSRTLTWRRNPIDSSTLGRKSAARPLASDLFATSNNAAAATTNDECSGSGTTAGVDAKTKPADVERDSEDTPTALARQRIARPRTGSVAALARRSRVTTSMYDPDLDYAEAPSSVLRPSESMVGVVEQDDGSKSKSAWIESGTEADKEADKRVTSETIDAPESSLIGKRSDALRRRIEALKSEVGDDWLRLLARGGGSEGDRNSALVLSAVTEEQSIGKASEGKLQTEQELTCSRVLRPKKSKKKIRTNISNGNGNIIGGESSLSRRTSVDHTTEETSGRRREARIT
ncbi:uncharacterized protein MEPE_03512 [Melanopsichium pennsylvanicum]|uniref:Uncharacterized protein n=2 Tax=Melanopsichium pennsylvanicum TaxID=63383 RepID=A0AAJ4XPK3_9BASI|nr:hypothetical leucine-rich protein [Melanopsichium pennsylvanicum 4]SNX84803.1 uncharacterized protein MEPE_03512 [Melanopsichium pennsylvanicum]